MEQISEQPVISQCNSSSHESPTRKEEDMLIAETYLIYICAGFVLPIFLDLSVVIVIFVL